MKDKLHFKRDCVCVPVSTAADLDGWKTGRELSEALFFLPVPFFLRLGCVNVN